MKVNIVQKKRTKTPSQKKASNKTNTRMKKQQTMLSEAEQAKADNTLRNYELLGILMVAIGLISGCGLAGFNVGFVGAFFAKFQHYFFGMGAPVAAMMFVALGGYYIMKHQKLQLTARIWGGAALLICSLALCHHFMVKPGEEILPESLIAGGGLLGGVVLFALRKVLGTDGAMIMLCAGTVGSVLVTTTWSLAKGILTTKKQAEKGADVAKEAAVVVYDKTKEVGVIAKEHMQEHVSEVSDRLKKLKGKRFLEKYEQDSAFLQEASKEFVAGAAASTLGSGVAMAAGTEEMPGPVGQTPIPASAEELVEANPVAADFFGEKFTSHVQPAEVPSLHQQPGIDELDATMQALVKNQLDNQEDDEVPEFDFDAEAVLENEEAIEPEDEAELEAIWQELENSTAMSEESFVDAEEVVTGEPEKQARSFALSVQTLDNQEADEVEPDDYGIDAMEITVPEGIDATADISEESSIDDGGADDAYDPLTEAINQALQPDSANARASSIGQQLQSDADDALVKATGLATEQENEPVEPLPPPYEVPPIHLLAKTVKTMNEALHQEINAKARILGETLSNFKVKATIVNACHGPAVTRYEVKPAPGVKVSKITGLSDDIALSMAATAVRIEQIPGKSAIGIEVPNQELESVQLREVLEKPGFDEAKSRLTVGLGKDISGQAIFADLAKMPHLLVAGATGSGKSVCINTLITSILFKAKPDEVKFILIDPKMVELSVYNDIPHLMVPVVTDARKAASVLNWAVQEMEKRYGLIAQVGVRNMEGYNKLFVDTPEKQLPSIVIIIDELADLMMVAPHDVEDAICRIAQKARAAGIYLVLATQRPSVNVITGVIKANIPSRISFAVTSQIDSRTILDTAGAEKLLGKGDMLFKPQEANKPTRIQGAFVSDQEVEQLVEYIKSQGHKLEANQEIIDFTNKAMETEQEGEDSGANKSKVKMDSLLRDAVELTMSSNNASASSFQRRYHIGYSRAGRLLDTMEQLGIVGPPQGSKPREILVTEAQAFEIMDNYENEQ